MIFADKVVQLRKKSGWSQEELAEKLNVTRQSVSKWEGAQSIPDLEKILQLAQIFGVSTDYLLKDELAEAEYTKSDDSSSVRRVSMEEANAFLQVKQATAGRIAFATFLCILSPICLFLLAAASETGMLPLIGLGVIFFIVGGVNWASMEKLLQEGDYTRTKKKTSSITGVVSTVYWCVAAAVYLACSLPGHSWRESWVIWPVAGVLFAAVMAVCSALAGRKK